MAEELEQMVDKQYIVKRWSITVRTIDRWVEKGYLTAYKGPGDPRRAPVRFKLSDVESLMTPVAVAE